jgi:hypothetical protein
LVLLAEAGAPAFFLLGFFLGLHAFLGDGRVAPRLGLGAGFGFGFGLHGGFARRTGRFTATVPAPTGLAVADEGPPTTIAADRISVSIRTPQRRLFRRCVRSTIHVSIERGVPR